MTITSRTRVVTELTLSTPRLAALTGLRFIVALSIVIFHVMASDETLAPTLKDIYPDMGVSLFYVLSGYILQHSYRDSVTSIGFVRFVSLRYARVWPCHVVVIALICLYIGRPVIDFFVVTFSPTEIFAAVFLLQAWIPDAKSQFALNGPAWSLSVELFFYATFPVLSQLARRSTVGMLALCVGTSLAWIGWVLHGLALDEQNADYEAWIARNPLTRLAEFGAGIALREWQSWPNRSALCIDRQFARIGGVCLVLVTLLMLTPALCRIAVPEVTRLSILLVCFALQAPIFVLVVAWLSCSHDHRLLASRPLVWLGEISFALYLVHQPVLFIMRSHVPVLAQAPRPLQALVYCVVTLSLSAGLFTFVERPAMAAARRAILGPKK